MTEIEREKTYLLKALPDGLTAWRSTIIRDIYVPEAADHAVLRLRQKGGKYEMTKKIPVSGTDSSRQHEHTILLSQEEFEALAKCSTKQIIKRRFFGDLAGHSAEVDVFMGTLEGLAVVDFEFDSDDKLAAFAQPDIALADVTQDEWIAGGKLAGKSYNDILPALERYGYQSVHIKGIDTDNELAQEGVA